MKKTIIRFKERINTRRGYEVYYKEIPKILTRYYFHKLAKKGCWDIEIIDIEDIAKMVDRVFKNASPEEKEYIKNDNEIFAEYVNNWLYHPMPMSDNHIPYIDWEDIMKEIIDEEKVSHYMNNDEAVIVMDKKDFDNNFIHKDKIREKIKQLKKEVQQIEEIDIGIGFTLGRDWVKRKGAIEVLNDLLEED